METFTLFLTERAFDGYLRPQTDSARVEDVHTT